MSYSAIQNTPILVNLLDVAVTTGWSVDGNTGIATHTTCNDGKIRLVTYPITAGVTYQVSYSVLAVSGGYVQLQAGTALGTHRTTTELFVETIVASGTNPVLVFYSDANCQIQAFNIRIETHDTSNYQKNTIVFSALNRKWSDYRTMAPDFGFSLFINTYPMYAGDLYIQENGSNDRNNFFGTQYNSIFKFVENKDSAIIKSYNSLVIQANELLVTSANGITTSLGQISELIALDFQKAYLVDGATNVTIYSVEGVYSSSFMRDSNSDGGIINGTVLKGNYIQIELTTIDGSQVLQLYTVAVNASRSFIGAR